MNRFALLLAWAAVIGQNGARADALPMERQLTHDAVNHTLDNNDNFSPDDRWLSYDTRVNDDAIGSNPVIGCVSVDGTRDRVVYREKLAKPWGPGLGAASFNPVDGSVDFIRGLTSASAARPYEMWRRSGVYVSPVAGGDGGSFGPLHFMDARDVTPPFTPGALRGGTHRHEWSADGKWIGFTYNDAILADIEGRTGRKVNLRTIGVATRLGAPVHVHAGPENHDGEMFAVVMARVTPDPKPGTDEISKAFEDAWVGTDGYRRADGAWQKRARAFLGTLRGRDGKDFTEVFIADVPDRIDVPGEYGPLEGTPTTMPNPPRGATQRRLTFTGGRKYPGVALDPRHWVRSSSDGTRIVFLARDDAGVVQAFFVSPNGGPIVQVTHQATSIQSCVRWSPDGAHLLYVCGGSITICGAVPGAPGFGEARALTGPTDPIPLCPVWSHDGKTIAYNRMVPSAQGTWRQIFVIRP
jgi:hypothetical protein